MIRDRYAALGLFALVPQWHLQFEPELAELDRLLADDELFAQVKADLARRHPQSTRTGRPGTPVEVILRLLVVKHLYGWSYEQTEQFVNDSVVLRQFCRLYLAPVPDDTTLLRWANLIAPATLHRLLDRATELARARQVTRGRKLRLDSTVVETAIHHPSDSTLLADSVRVLSRLLRRAKRLVSAAARVQPALWRDRTRTAKRLARRIGATMVHQKEARERERRALYERLLAVARASRRQAEQVRGLVTGEGAPAGRLRQAFDHFLPLVAQVIDQAERRVVAGERVPASAKGLSLFEPHTAVLRRGKARQPTEFGTKLVLDEVDGGLISHYRLYAGNPDDALSLPESLTHQEQRFGRAPDLLAGDRPFYSRANCHLAEAGGCGGSCCPNAVSRGAVTPPANASAGSDAGTASGRASRDGSACSSGASGCGAAATTGWRAWSAGSAGAFSRTICGPSAAR